MRENYYLLVRAVVNRAVLDYRMYTQVAGKDPDNLDAMRILNDVRRFFKSRWFCVLTGLDGDFFLDALDVEMEKESAKQKKRRRRSRKKRRVCDGVR